MKQVNAYLASDGSLFRSRVLANKHEAKITLAKEMTKIQLGYDHTSSECRLVSPLANGDIPWSDLLDWIGANREDVQTIIDYLEAKS